MKLSIVVLTPGPTEGREVPIRTPTFLIGREPGCQLRPASPQVSGRHCALVQRQGKVLARDLGSASGTFVNDRPLYGEVELHDGDRLRVGPLLFAIHLKATLPVNLPTPLPPTRTAGQPASEDDIAAMLLEEDSSPSAEDDLTPRA
jgi:pSer/pThr/pTyr-binding forkhead associated (FHA) protein